ncbi:MAG: PAS-domain containing protein, partial [Pseudomonadota bacterium]
MDTISLPSARTLHGSRDTSVLLRSGLNMIQQALTIYSEDLRLIFANRRFGTMFDLPDRFSQTGATFGETLAFLA